MRVAFEIFFNELFLSHVCGGTHHGRAIETIVFEGTTYIKMFGMLVIGEWMNECS